MNDMAAFLKDLTDLTEKYQIVIGGCGCCGSPWASKMEQWHKKGKQFYVAQEKDGYVEMLKWGKEDDDI